MLELGKNEAESIGKFLEDMRLNQFLNAKPEWLEINFLFRTPKQMKDFQRRDCVSPTTRNQTPKGLTWIPRG
jgi:hypothetical protein